eukprot:4608781-Amphidinium_carterae.1
MFGGWGHSVIVERAFQALQDESRDKKNQTQSRERRWFIPMKAGLIRGHDKVEIEPETSVLEPTGKKLKLEKKLYEILGMEPSVADTDLRD